MNKTESLKNKEAFDIITVWGMIELAVKLQLNFMYLSVQCTTGVVGITGRKD